VPVSIPHVDRPVSADALLQVVSALYTELHHAQPEPPIVDLDSDLERDLGLDSLTRVELLSRIEQRFGLRLPQATLAAVETVADLLRAIKSAATPGASTGRSSTAATLAKPIPSPRPTLGTPAKATTLNEVLEWHVQQHPNTTHAIVLMDEQPQSLTYAALQDGARVVAGGLQRAGVQPGASVALMLPTAAEYLHAFFGVLLAGAVPVPIYPPTRPSQVEEHIHRHAEILTNADADALITFKEARSVARLLSTRVPGLRHVLSIGELMQGGYLRAMRHPPSADSIAMLQYTSGSTGSPKGVILTHNNLLANIHAMGVLMGANESDVFVSWLPLYHDMGLIGAWLGSLYFGCLLVLMPPTSFLARPQRWLRAIHDYRGTLSAAPNFGYELCARRVADQDLEGLDLSSWRLAFNGAEPVFPDTLERFRQRFAPHGFRPEAMAPVFGLAEAAVGLTFPPMGRGPIVDRIDRQKMTSGGQAVAVSLNEPNALEFVSCGRPLPGYQVRIIDTAGSEAPERIEGTLQFTGPSATQGYYHNADATARLLHGEWRDTGDRGYMAGGEVYITGRLKDIIIRRGRHIYPEEVEKAVAELAGVRKGCVAAFGTKEPIAATEKLVVVAETRYTDQTLRGQLKVRINERVVNCIGEPPEEILLVLPHTVLKTSSGKLRRAATRAAYEDGSLARGPASPAVQILRLAIESVLPALRRSRQASARVTYGVYTWLTFLGLALPVGLLALLVPKRYQAWRLSHRAAKGLIRAWRIPFSVTSEPGTDLSVPHVIVANHCSYLDSVFVTALLPTPHLFVAKAELSRIPTARAWLGKVGTLFVERCAPAESVAEVHRLNAELARGNPIIMFPEGTFTRVTGLRPFHLGAFQAAVAAGAPVVPITLRGTRSMLRPGQWLPRRVPVSAVIGRPLMARADGDAFGAAVRLRDATRDRILSYCGEPDLL
jgi:acyl carrier protein